MERIKRFRNTQPITLDQFILDAIDHPSCYLCSGLAECMQYMGEDMIEALEGVGCGGFDSSIEELTKHYLLKYCQQTVGT